MSNFFDFIFAWLESHQNILGWMGFVSLVMMVATLVTVPLIIIRLPSRYLTSDDDGLSEIPHFWRWPYLVFKNIVGLLLVLAGLAMLILPGQGLLTLVIGLALLNFPGKRRLVRHLIGQQRILGAINRLRARAHKEPLEAPQKNTGT